ncbi:hypothetical protein ASESINO_273 [Erwinia phage vB_EamM_Asesino]|uniref:Uncharacterized protein n=1 Tax=Erwinia phage vB_EamM_Asesino TaxID=1883370 RepID=A0A1B2IAL3_9CAUD|nr:hypothetical protein ASESINO_273 [Erwinia phage vB_EamM_Asesino]ANZ48286.1 hypothetical protein ASESINO_273 [Erwinia phage vB_EamM_Asesino]
MTTKVTSIKELSALIDAIEGPTVVLNEDLSLKAEPLQKLYEETLPTTKINDLEYRFTLEDANALRQHDANFLEVYGGIASGVIVDRAKADKDVAALDLKLDIGNASFSTVFARPTGDEPTKKEWEASIGFGYGAPKSKALEGKLRKSFAAAMMAGDEEDEE